MTEALSPRRDLTALMLGRSGEFTLEARATNLIFLFAALVETVIVIEMLLLGSRGVVTAVVAVSAIGCFAFYGLGRSEPERAWLAGVFLLQHLGLLLYDWSAVLGSRGLALPLLVVLFGVLPIILPRARIKAGYALLSVGIIMMFGIVELQPEFYDTYRTNPQGVYQVLFEIVVLGLGLTATVFHTKASFTRRKDEVLALNAQLEVRNRELEEAMAEVKTLRGIVPICAHCKSIRNDQGYYESVEHYMSRHTEMEFTHGYCPDCMRKYYGEFETD